MNPSYAAPLLRVATRPGNPGIVLGFYFVLEMSWDFILSWNCPGILFCPGNVLGDGPFLAKGPGRSLNFQIKEVPLLAILTRNISSNFSP